MDESLSDNTKPDTTIRAWRVIVVDDCLPYAELMSGMLRSLGHHVCTTYDGFSALAAFRHFSPDAYVIAMSLTDISGVNVCRALRLMPDGDALAIIAVAATARDDELAQALGVGFSAFLLRPVLPQDVIACFAESRRR